jgi:hypothetical protein
MEHAKYLAYHEKTKPTNHGVKEGEEIQTKGIDNLINRLIAENFLTLRKREPPRCKHLVEHQTVRTKKETPPRHIIINTLITQNKERILKAAKEKRKVTYKANPLK